MDSRGHSYRQILLSIAARSATATTSFPSNITSPPNIQLARLPGKYSNPSYGSFELCPISSPRNSHSAACKDVILEAPRMLPGAIDPSKLTFVAKWDKVWSTHLVFTHFNMNIFNVTILMSIVSFVFLDGYSAHRPIAYGRSQRTVLGHWRPVSAGGDHGVCRASWDWEDRIWAHGRFLGRGPRSSWPSRGNSMPSRGGFV